MSERDVIAQLFIHVRCGLSLLCVRVKTNKVANNHEFAVASSPHVDTAITCGDITSQVVAKQADRSQILVVARRRMNQAAVAT